MTDEDPHGASLEVFTADVDTTDRTPEVVLYGDCPGGCGTRMPVDWDTDGHGNVIEYVERCRDCRPSALHKPRDGQVVRQCRVCGSHFGQPRKRGRPRVLCPRCCTR